MAGTSDRLQPALLGGVFIGVLSSFLFLNVCCCLWMIAGGMVAAYLFQQNHPHPMTAADGAFVGLLSGVIGGAIAALLAVPIFMVVGPALLKFLERSLAGNPEVPEQTLNMIRDAIDRSGRISAVGTAINMVLYACVGAVFAMLGGLLGVAVFKKSQLPPPPGPAVG